jgi:hypothetical protein
MEKNFYIRMILIWQMQDFIAYKGPIDLITPLITDVTPPAAPINPHTNTAKHERTNGGGVTPPVPAVAQVPQRDGRSVPEQRSGRHWHPCHRPTADPATAQDSECPYAQHRSQCRHCSRRNPYQHHEYPERGDRCCRPCSTVHPYGVHGS